MKTFLALAVLLASPMSLAQEFQFSGLLDSNAGQLTELLMNNSKNDPRTHIDTSVYPFVAVTRIDDYSTIDCTKHEFGATPAQYHCVIYSTADRN